MDYRDSHTRPGYGISYDNHFVNNPLRMTIWKLEREILDHVLSNWYINKPIRHLDFACGTGRILCYLEDRTEVSIGVDLSSSMLEQAKKKVKRAKIIEADITRVNALGMQKFNLITAFRFFSNAQPELRNEVINALLSYLEKDGYLVFNKHQNLSSLLYRLARVLKKGGTVGMAHSEVEELMAKAGMEICHTYHVGVIPCTENRMLLPSSLYYVSEKILAKIKVFSNLAVNRVFVCKKTT